MKRFLIVLLFLIVKASVSAMEEYELTEIKPRQSQENKDFDETLLSAVLDLNKDAVKKEIEKLIQEGVKENVQTPLMVLMYQNPQLSNLVRQRIEQLK